jgi:hypothetical protein
MRGGATRGRFHGTAWYKPGCASFARRSRGVSDQAVKLWKTPAEVTRMKLTPSEAAAEAVVACFLNFMRSNGNPRAFTADQTHVHDWLSVVFGDDVNKVAAAMWYAERMLSGKAKPI